MASSTLARVSAFTSGALAQDEGNGGAGDAGVDRHILQPHAQATGERRLFRQIGRRGSIAGGRQAAALWPLGTLHAQPPRR